MGEILRGLSRPRDNYNYGRTALYGNGLALRETPLLRMSPLEIYTLIQIALGIKEFLPKPRYNEQKNPELLAFVIAAVVGRSGVHDHRKNPNTRVEEKCARTLEFPF